MTPSCDIIKSVKETQILREIPETLYQWEGNLILGVIVKLKFAIKSKYFVAIRGILLFDIVTYVCKKKYLLLSSHYFEFNLNSADLSMSVIND